jgi:asparagine synthetase B (glutamine-hydrolysing)
MGSLALVYRRGGRPHDPAPVERMLRAAPHRGLEHRIATRGQVSLGISNDAELRDVWLVEAGDSAAVFAGTLDNRAELAAELARSGADVPADDPAAVVLEGFRRHGTALFNRLRGAFTGAIVDGSSLRCFRDHLGFRSLFFHDGSEGLFLATEAKQIVAGAGISREPNLEGLENLFWGGGPKNALKDIERFPRGSYGTVDADGTWSIGGYWDPSALLETARLTPAEARERLVEVLELAVVRTVTGNDAVSLSGGLDSPTVAAFAAPRHLELSGRPLRAISAVYPHLPSVDERPYIELVADRLGLELHTYVPQARSLDDLTFWVDLLDAPVDTLSMPEVAELYRAVHATGARNTMSGELVEYATTARYFTVPHLLLHGRWRPAAGMLRTEHRRGRAWWRLGRQLLLETAPPFVASRVGRRLKRPWTRLPPWMDTDVAGGAWRRPELDLPARQRWQRMQLGPFGSGPASPNFEANEICAAYIGIQSRYPLADIDLWEFFLSLPAEIKYPNRVVKGLIRDVMTGRLPDEIVWRHDKTVFDEHLLATADYPELRRWILETNGYRMNGIDYELLRERIERQELDVIELRRARDLARIHAFVSRFE